jgi:hypothetical protein
MNIHLTFSMHAVGYHSNGEPMSLTSASILTALPLPPLFSWFLSLVGGVVPMARDSGGAAGLAGLIKGVTGPFASSRSDTWRRFDGSCPDKFVMIVVEESAFSNRLMRPGMCNPWFDATEKKKIKSTLATLLLAWIP